MMTPPGTELPEYEPGEEVPDPRWGKEPRWN
jgi:hypothetical protein